ncbi:response regulator [Emticicia sp. 21SJ11W-3]|uniref:response regulator n=1 Tax=Emticicia sp. 21SJ11W-3 TaxID=2916755 RepID=UPI00209EF9A2|nr:response regulator [Emticicia sp. 21SJ11W-3]UTA70129.1 response regulator [Emticicia sp. 21SJ11W-3]
MKINNVWIIDDDKILTYVLKRMLASINVFENIEIFQNGKEAFNQLTKALTERELLPDIILLDLNMPVMDGWQFLDEFERLDLNKKITLYIVSSSIDTQDHEKAANYTVVSDFLVKPIGKKQIEQLVTDYTA